MTGRTELHQRLDANKTHHRISLNSLAHGLYHITILDEQDQAIGQERILKN